MIQITDEQRQQALDWLKKGYDIITIAQHLDWYAHELVPQLLRRKGPATDTETAERSEPCTR